MVTTKDVFKLAVEDVRAALEDKPFDVDDEEKLVARLLADNRITKAALNMLIVKYRDLERRVSALDDPSKKYDS